MTHTTDGLFSIGLTDSMEVRQRQARCVSRAARSAAPRPHDDVSYQDSVEKVVPALRSLKLRDR